MALRDGGITTTTDFRHHFLIVRSPWIPPIGFAVFDAVSGHGLSGCGSINANVDFDGSSVLWADDGALNVTNAWNANAADQVGFNSSALIGGRSRFMLRRGITGYGAVCARVINNSRLRFRGCWTNAGG